MPEAQTYATHRRWVPLYHFVTPFLLLIVLAWSVWHAVRHPAIATVMTIVLVVAVALVFYYAREFALTVQNRVIRLEEQLRLTRLLPADLKTRIPDLSPGQLVGLRFASDQEVPGLVREVLDKGIDDGEAIKRMIRTWRPDTLRA